MPPDVVHQTAMPTLDCDSQGNEESALSDNERGHINLNMFEDMPEDPEQTDTQFSGEDIPESECNHILS